jgi:hypothetical protein
VDDDFEFTRTGTKAVVSGAVSIFILGAVFWAGATYNRVQGIETHLINIDVTMAKLGDLQTLEERTADMQRRLDKLEDKLK